jgi:hypothetical protein
LLRRRSPALLQASLLRPHLLPRRHDQARQRLLLPSRQRQARRSRSTRLGSASRTCAANAGSVVKATA